MNTNQYFSHSIHCLERPGGRKESSLKISFPWLHSHLMVESYLWDYGGRIAIVVTKIRLTQVSFEHILLNGALVLRSWTVGGECDPVLGDQEILQVKSFCFFC
jgi:hypothetical protein